MWYILFMSLFIIGGLIYGSLWGFCCIVERTTSEATVKTTYPTR